MVCVPELAAGIEQYSRLGFSIHPGGEHPGVGTRNAIAFFEDDYLELIAVRDEAEYRASSPYRGLLELAGRGGGMAYVIVQSDDLDADVAAMRARGVEVGEPKQGERRTPSGGQLRWRSAMLGERNLLPLFFIQHLTPAGERRRLAPGAGAHPNGALRIARAYIAVPDLKGSAERYAAVLGMQPKLERGTVINADMAVFDLGPAGLTLAQPFAPGPAAEALERGGPGPFQVLLRTSAMEGAARWMAGHGVPPPARGIRNTGEHALLVSPPHACGAYVGFVGPA